MIKYLGLLGFLTWFIQTQKIFDKIRIPIFQEIRQCRLCLGTWIGIGLYPVMETKLTKHPLDIFFVGAFFSWLWYVFSEGWKSLYTTIEIR